jgi:hypothetical protein
MPYQRIAVSVSAYQYPVSVQHRSGSWCWNYSCAGHQVPREMHTNSKLATDATILPVVIVTRQYPFSTGGGSGTSPVQRRYQCCVISSGPGHLFVTLFWTLYKLTDSFGSGRRTKNIQCPPLTVLSSRGLRSCWAHTSFGILGHRRR